MTYLLQKKSREESQGAGSGVEIIVNEPYSNGPGGNGQYTHKIYHVGSHLPEWFKSLLPRSALIAKEEAWNAYPYTKTRYTCPFVEKFSIEIETYYFPDNGYQENVFKLSGSDLRNRIVGRCSRQRFLALLEIYERYRLRNRISDVIDIVKDVIPSDYVKEEDPKLYVSQKTGRGPLTESWLEEYWADVKVRNLLNLLPDLWIGLRVRPFILRANFVDCLGKATADAVREIVDVRVQTLPRGIPVLGRANKAGEVHTRRRSVLYRRFVCSFLPRMFGDKVLSISALRKTMVRAHKQAWAWQDEWNGLTMEDIREIEKQTQLALQKRMGGIEAGEEATEENQEKATSNATMTPQESGVAKTLAATLGSIEKNEDLQSPPSLRKSSDIAMTNTAVSSEGEVSPEDSPTEVPDLR